MATRRGDNDKLQTVSSSRLSRPTEAGPLITLLTDFGTADYFVGAMKGAILTINPQARIVDITHEIPPQDLETAAFTLLACYDTFPEATIHLAVVDPGVGSARLPILVQTDRHYFVGPDNGIFSYVCERESKSRVYQLTNQEVFRRTVSNTFHGRDIFAPVAAALTKGMGPNDLGTVVEDYVRLDSLAPKVGKDGRMQARIIHIDAFGNCVTNISREVMALDDTKSQATLKVNGKMIRSFRHFFAEENVAKKELFAIWGSAGFLEIAVQNDSAAKILKARRGDKVMLHLNMQQFSQKT